MLNITLTYNSSPGEIETPFVVCRIFSHSCEVNVFLAWRVYCQRNRCKPLERRQRYVEYWQRRRLADYSVFRQRYLLVCGQSEDVVKQGLTLRIKFFNWHYYFRFERTPQIKVRFLHEINNLESRAQNTCHIKTCVYEALRVRMVEVSVDVHLHDVLLDYRLVVDLVDDQLPALRHTSKSELVNYG